MKAAATLALYLPLVLGLRLNSLAEIEEETPWLTEQTPGDVDEKDFARINAAGCTQAFFCNAPTHKKLKDDCKNRRDDKKDEIAETMQQFKDENHEKVHALYTAIPALSNFMTGGLTTEQLMGVSYYLSTGNVSIATAAAGGQANVQVVQQLMLTPHALRQVFAQACAGMLAMSKDGMASRMSSNLDEECKPVGKLYVKKGWKQNPKDDWCFVSGRCYDPIVSFYEDRCEYRLKKMKKKLDGCIEDEVERISSDLFKGGQQQTSLGAGASAGGAATGGGTASKSPQIYAAALATSHAVKAAGGSPMAQQAALQAVEAAFAMTGASSTKVAQAAAYAVGAAGGSAAARAAAAQIAGGHAIQILGADADIGLGENMPLEDSSEEEIEEAFADSESTEKLTSAEVLAKISEAAMVALAAVGADDAEKAAVHPELVAAFAAGIFDPSVLATKVAQGMARVGATGQEINAAATAVQDETIRLQGLNTPAPVQAPDPAPAPAPAPAQSPSPSPSSPAFDQGGSPSPAPIDMGQGGPPADATMTQPPPTIGSPSPAFGAGSPSPGGMSPSPGAMSPSPGGSPSPSPGSPAGGAGDMAAMAGVLAGMLSNAIVAELATKGASAEEQAVVEPAVLAVINAGGYQPGGDTTALVTAVGTALSAAGADSTELGVVGTALNTAILAFAAMTGGAGAPSPAGGGPPAGGPPGGTKKKKQQGRKQKAGGRRLMEVASEQNPQVTVEQALAGISTTYGGGPVPVAASQAAAAAGATIEQIAAAAQGAHQAWSQGKSPYDLAEAVRHAMKEKGALPTVQAAAAAAAAHKGEELKKQGAAAATQAGFASANGGQAAQGSGAAALAAAAGGGTPTIDVTDLSVSAFLTNLIIFREVATQMAPMLNKIEASIDECIQDHFDCEP